MTTPHPTRPFRPKRLAWAVCIMVTVSGCAGWKVDKTVLANPEDMAMLAAKAQRVQAFHEAVYDVSIFAADRCATTATREPFTLVTLGPLTNHYSKAQFAAYWHGLGWDETFRVQWAHPDSPLREGEQVIAINGAKLENNKTGLGELPLARYLPINYDARNDAAKGEPYTVTLADGRVIAIELKPACRTQVWALPYWADTEDYTILPRFRTDAVIMAPTAIDMAASRDEYRYLAGMAMYFGSGAEGEQRRDMGGILMFAAMAASVAMPLLYPIISPVTMSIQKALAEGTDEARAALFATDVVMDMGGDPYAGLHLMERIEAAGRRAFKVVLDEKERAQLKAYIDGKMSSDASATAPNTEKATESLGGSLAEHQPIASDVFDGTGS